ncbi:N-acetylmuramoyl-L-alanine amidase [Flavobacterium sp.]|uniref:N-acetylmuramoyl-L-alanine amidase family protein n=1 Tax=Flavobacterium sp. TaxID=239 RepID=UPI003752E0ED
MKFNYKILFFALLVTAFTCESVFSQGNQKFTIILDAGHGGKDPGNSYHGYSEKEIALKTTLKVGEFLEKEKDFKVIYTRKKDVFIELVNRPKIANKANANLFVSIHCNSVKNFEPSGTETFVMGLSRSNMNLEVAKNENSVILLEDNYKENYQGFDPKKPESLLGLTIIQEENLKNSIILATEIQNNFTSNLDRKTRGVKQQPLWVLDAAYMPSVLIELGFLSNVEEGAFLNSEEGQTKMAKQIAQAIVNYKKEYFGEQFIKQVQLPIKNKTEDTIEKPIKKIEKKDIILSKDEKQTIGLIEDVYRVQLCASSKKIAVNPSNFKGLKNVSVEKSSSVYKYFYGKTSSIEAARKLQQEAKKKGYASAFIVLVKEDKSIFVKE